LFPSLTTPNLHNGTLQTPEFLAAFIQARNATPRGFVESLLANGILLKLFQKQF